MTPYFEQDGCTIWHGDCREILPHLPNVDLVLTDPPYGIASVWKGGLGRGWARAREQAKVRNRWDDKPPNDQEILNCVAMAEQSIVWGGNYYQLGATRGWLVWNKPERGFTLSEAELAWTTFDAPIRVKDLPRSEPGRQHPTQKPIELMKWCIERAGETAQTILDPFMGSGTTLVAARDMGRRAIGIEIEEKYCEIAANRLRQGVLF